MPIRNCPFTRIYDDDIPRLILPVRIINPHSNKSINEPSFTQINLLWIARFSVKAEILQWQFLNPRRILEYHNRLVEALEAKVPMADRLLVMGGEFFITDLCL